MPGVSRKGASVHSSVVETIGIVRGWEAPATVVFAVHVEIPVDSPTSPASLAHDVNVCAKLYLRCSTWTGVRTRVGTEALSDCEVCARRMVLGLRGLETRPRTFLARKRICS